MECEVASEHMKRYSTSLSIKEMDIKPTVRYYFIPTRMTGIKKTHVGKDGKKLEPLYTLVTL